MTNAELEQIVTGIAQGAAANTTAIAGNAAAIQGIHASIAGNTAAISELKTTVAGAAETANKAAEEAKKAAAEAKAAADDVEPDNFQQTWKGREGFWSKTARVAEIGAIGVAYATPTFLLSRNIVRRLQTRSAARMAVDQMMAQA